MTSAETWILPKGLLVEVKISTVNMSALLSSATLGDWGQTGFQRVQSLFGCLFLSLTWQQTFLCISPSTVSWLASSCYSGSTVVLLIVCFFFSYVTVSMYPMDVPTPLDHATAWYRSSWGQMDFPLW